MALFSKKEVLAQGNVGDDTKEPVPPQKIETTKGDETVDPNKMSERADEPKEAGELPAETKIEENLDDKQQDS